MSCSAATLWAVVPFSLCRYAVLCPSSAGVPACPPHCWNLRQHTDLPPVVLWHFGLPGFQDFPPMSSSLFLPSCFQHCNLFRDLLSGSPCFGCPRWQFISVLPCLQKVTDSLPFVFTVGMVPSCPEDHIPCSVCPSPFVIFQHPCINEEWLWLPLLSQFHHFYFFLGIRLRNMPPQANAFFEV